MTPTPKSTYESGSCRVLTYHAHYHELWCDERLVTTFTTFRAAVAYMMREFQ